MAEMRYIGCFFDWEDLERGLTGWERMPLARTVVFPHVTFSYRPEYVPMGCFGEEVVVKAVGYGNDGENEALKVELLTVPEGLKALALRIEVPHITLSVSEAGKAVNSRGLQFEAITPFLLTGVFGGVDEEKGLHTNS